MEGRFVGMGEGYRSTGPVKTAGEVVACAQRNSCEGKERCVYMLKEMENPEDSAITSTYHHTNRPFFLLLSLFLLI